MKKSWWLLMVIKISIGYSSAQSNIGITPAAEARTSDCRTNLQVEESFLKDSKKNFPCACYLNGEYGHKDIYAGVPCVIGKDGVEKIIEIELNSEEKESFEYSISCVKELINKIS